MGGAAFSPYFPGYSKFSHFGDDDVDILDFDTLQFGPNAFFQFDQGWTLAGIGVMLDFVPTAVWKNLPSNLQLLLLAKGSQ